MMAWMEKYFDVVEPWEAWWLLFGLAAQATFLGRWIVQWVATERRRKSVVPMLFWWFRLVGATLLLIYFIGRREPIGILGQAFGWTVYSRNIYFRLKHRAPPGEPPP